jgi:hypothetical protein
VLVLNFKLLRLVYQSCSTDQSRGVLYNASTLRGGLNYICSLVASCRNKLCYIHLGLIVIAAIFSSSLDWLLLIFRVQCKGI